MSIISRCLIFSSLTITLFAQSGGDVVSVEELRNPLTGKSLHMILTAQEHLKSGQRERGMEELRAAMDQAISAELYFDDPHGTPAYRRHLTYYFAGEILGELTGFAV